jgi:integrase
VSRDFVRGFRLCDRAWPRNHQSGPGHEENRDPERKRYVENAELDAIGAAGSPVIQAVIDLAYVAGQRISDVLDLSLDVKEKNCVTLVQRKTGHRMKLRRTAA